MKRKKYSGKYSEEWARGKPYLARNKVYFGEREPYIRGNKIYFSGGNQKGAGIVAVVGSLLWNALPLGNKFFWSRMRRKNNYVLRIFDRSKNFWSVEFFMLNINECRGRNFHQIL